ncbi:DUF3231 family protein [Peribacillus sp. SCS-26]|uniref:DUF3231 family protein n=1 Tax=Paraperibacillus marinus TaxID=3115295 RepID=UPI003905D50C
MNQEKMEAPLTAPEIAALWSQYMNDSLSKCVLLSFLGSCRDGRIREVLQFALMLSERHLEKGGGFLLNENYPLPVGFQEEDNKSAPPLFSESFMLFYIYIMSIHGMTRYAGAIGIIIREDQRRYFMECCNETMELYNKSITVLADIGLISRPPTLHNRHEVEFIKKESYMENLFSGDRPLNVIEISGMYLNLQKTDLKAVLETGFGQTAQSKEVKAFMKRAKKLCEKHFDLLASILRDNELPAPRNYSAEVTDSTSPPFSDKLMLYHTAMLLSSAIGYFGEALSVSQRKDLSSCYTRMIAEIALLAEDGMELLIRKGWMEQPPSAADRKGLLDD